MSCTLNETSKIETPFGNFIVKINDKKVKFSYELKNKEYYNKNNTYYKIYIKTDKLKIGDEITCEIEECTLFYNDGDERSDLLTTEDEKLIIGLCGYEPQYHGFEENLHSYYLEVCDKNFKYSIQRQPQDFLESFYKSHVITLSLGWIEKKKYEDYDTAIFMILDD